MQREFTAFFYVHAGKDIGGERVIRLVPDQPRVAVDDHLPHILGPRDQRAECTALTTKAAALGFEIDDQRF